MAAAPGPWPDLTVARRDASGPAAVDHGEGSSSGAGLATAALREAVDLAFGELRLHRIQAETLTHNERSQWTLRRVGFEQYGVAEQYMHIADQWQDNVLYQLLTTTPERVATYVREPAAPSAED